MARNKVDPKMDVAEQITQVIETVVVGMIKKLMKRKAISKWIRNLVVVINLDTLNFIK